MKIESRMHSCFMAGMISAFSMTVFMQDVMGLEWYIDHVRNHWINLHWVWGLLMLIGSLGYYVWQRYNVRMDR